MTAMIVCATITGEIAQMEVPPASLTVGSDCTDHLADLMLPLAERFSDLTLAIVGIPEWLDRRLVESNRIAIFDLRDFAEPVSWERALPHSGSS